MMFIDLDYICLLNDMYDDYCCECEEQGIEPLSEGQWYELIYSNMEQCIICYYMHNNQQRICI